jgi:hypothetical protein
MEGVSLVRYDTHVLITLLFILLSVPFTPYVPLATRTHMSHVCDVSLWLLISGNDTPDTILHTCNNLTPIRKRSRPLGPPPKQL